MSVIIAFRDAGPFLAETIASVEGQTYPNVELLLVDDGSTDESSTVARRTAEAHPEWVRYCEHPGHVNRGESASRNLGFQCSRGEYIAFLDADDVWMPRKLEQQVRCLETHPDVNMVYGRIRHWFGWTGLPADVARDMDGRLGVAADRVYFPPDLVERLLERQAGTPIPSNPLLRRRIVEAVGGWEEDRAFSVYQDRVFFVKVELSGGVYVSDECWVSYRRHDGSMSSTLARSGGRNAARRAYLRWLERHLRARGYRGSRVWRLGRSHWVHTRPLLAGALRVVRAVRRRLPRLPNEDGRVSPASPLR